MTTVGRPLDGETKSDPLQQWIVKKNPRRRTLSGLLPDLSRCQLLCEDVEELRLLFKQGERGLPEARGRELADGEGGLCERGRRDVPVLRGETEDDRELSVELATGLDVCGSARCELTEGREHEGKSRTCEG